MVSFFTVPHTNVADYLTEVAKGNVAGASIIHKFGKNTGVGTSYEPVAIDGVYPTPQIAGREPVRVKSGGHGTDTAAGIGAREITVEGIIADGSVATNVLATAGSSASANSSDDFIRIYRAYVSKSGTYASATTGSHSADIEIEGASSGDIYAVIKLDNFPKAQSEIGAYTIPAGHTGYLLSAFGFADSSKVTELLFFQRTNILQTSEPYDAMRVVFEERAEGGEFTAELKAPLKFVGPCDIGFMARVTAGSGAEVEVDFEILLIED